MTIVWSIKNVRHEVSNVFYVEYCLRKFMKFFWINLLTVTSGLPNIHGFQIKVENNKIAELY